MSSAGLVSLAFAISACSLCPLLVLGIWWRGLTRAGALSGLGVGGGLAVASGLWRILSGPGSGWPGAILAQPTIAIVPIAFATMIGVSLLTARRIPADIGRMMARQVLRLAGGESVESTLTLPADLVVRESA